MSWNNALEKKRFDAKEKELMRQYREAGMSEESIKELYELDWEIYKSDRRFYEHNQSLDGIQTEMKEDKSPYYQNYLEQLTYNLEDAPQYSELWMEEIEDVKLHKALSLLNDMQRQLVYFAWILGINQVTIASVMKLDQSNISRELAKIKEFIKAVYNQESQACESGNRTIAGGTQNG